MPSMRISIRQGVGALVSQGQPEQLRVAEEYYKKELTYGASVQQTPKERNWPLIDPWKCRCRPFSGVRLELRLDHERNTYE